MSDVWKGVALPWGPGIPSFIEPKDDEAILRSSVIWILLTRRGERVMLPEFGGPISDAVFEPNDPALITQLQMEVQEAIERWDDRITFVDLEAEVDAFNPNQLNVKILWKNAKDPLADRIYTSVIEVTPSMITSRLGG